MSFIDYLETNCTTSRVSGGSQLLVEEDCPFCGSFGGIYVGAAKEIGLCFKCSKGFNGVQFVAAYEDVSRKRAFKLLGGSDDRYHGLEDEEELKDPERWFPPCEPLNEIAQKYMQDRGFDLDFCNAMGLMFCTQNVATDDGKIHYTNNRVIIPIYDRHGQCVSWQGRDITGKSKIKYLFQPGFRGAEHLYNIHRVVAGQPIIIVEGVMDAWGWIRAGYINVLATWGKKISEQQLVSLCSLKPGTIYMAWDGDAIFERAEFVERYGHLFDVRMVGMKDKDADELTGSQLQNLVGSATGYNWQEKILAGLNKC